MKNNLSSRLLDASKLVSSSPVIDVGSDHGLLAMYLEEKNFKVYASENKKGPYEILTQNIKINNSNVDVLFLDGIKNMPIEIKSVVILGMGGDTIYKILNEGKERLPYLNEIIIEPQSNFKKAIEFLYKVGFKNVFGKMVFEKKYYPLLKYIKGDENHKLNELELNYGSFLVSSKDKLLINKLTIELNKLNQLNSEAREKNKKKIDEIEHYLDLLN